MIFGQYRTLKLAFSLSFAFAAAMHGQATSTTSNALDRVNFGDTGTDVYSESTHAFVNLGNPTGTGLLGLTWRQIAPSATTANIGIPADNEALTFTMACSPTLQNYLTIQISGSDTTINVIYLYNATQGYDLANYYATNEPEFDFQETADPLLAGRFVYETLPIPLSMTTGKTSVTLTLNAAYQYGYYSSGTTNLAAGQTSRPIYAAFTHTNPYLIANSTDPQGTAPSAAAPTPATYNSGYFSAIQSTLTTYLSTAAADQAFGSSWTAAVTAGKVPPQIIGYFDTGKSPSSNYTLTQWLNNAAIDTGAGNNVAMERLDMLAYAYITPNFLSSFYQNATTEQAIVAALDAYSYMQSLNGCYGDMTVWDGVGATTVSTSSPQGRTNAQCNPIEGNGTWALGSAITYMKNDPTFLAALNQPISSTLEPGVMRYQAYQTMLVNHINFLTGSIGHGHAPNQDLFQAKAYVYANLALRTLDAIYSTSLAQSNATMYSNYLNETSGLATEQYGGIWISNGGLGLELNGTGNGSWDGGYGWNDAYELVWLAKILNDNGIETSTSHPVRTVAINAVHAFSNFLYPALLTSGSSFINTMREEEDLTFRKNYNVGEINTGSLYYAALDFNDPYALHGFYLEHANGITQPMNEAGPWTALPSVGSGNADDNAVQYLHEYADYVTLCNMVNTTPTDPTGITFLNEAAHADGVWADPTGSTITIKHAGEKLAMVLNWRPLQAPGTNNKPSASAEVVNNLARVHDTTATTDRISTVMMPSSTATGSAGSYASGSFGTLYVGRYGNYLVGLNWQSSTATLTLPPDMTSGTATDLVSGTNYDLTATNSVPVPANGAVALFQTVPTATLNASSLTFPATALGSSSATQTITVANPGTGPLLIGTVSLTGTNATDFSYSTTCTPSLSATSSCAYNFTFSPQAVGTRTATFNFKSSVSTTAQTVSLTGTAVPAVIPTLTLSTTPGTVTLAAAGSTTSLLSLTAGGGLSGSVSLVCSSPQSFITCTLPASASVSTSPTSVSVNISVAATVAADRPQRMPFSTHDLPLFAMLGFVPLLLLRKRKQKPLLNLLTLSLLISIAALSGCGGSTSTTPKLPPAGTYGVTITGSSSSLSQASTTAISVVVTN